MTDKLGTSNAGLSGRLDAARAGDASALLLKGVRGGGRTHALDQLVAASAPHWQVVRTTSSQSERPLAFGGLAALIHRVGIVVPELQPAAARMLRRLGADATSVTLALLVDVLEFLERLATDRTTGRYVLIVVDDAHHLDDASTAVLRFVASRISSPGLLLVIAVEDREERFDHPELPVVSMRSITIVDATDMLRESAGVEPDAEVVATLLTHAADVPATLLLVAGQLTTDHLAGWRRLPIPLPPVASTAAPELVGLTDPCRWALALAALCHVDDTGVVGRALEIAGTGWQDLEAAEGLGLVRLDDRRVRFPSSAVRSLAPAPFPSRERRRLHAAITQAIEEHAPMLRESWAHHAASAALVSNGELVAAWVEVASVATDCGRPLEAARAAFEAVLHAPAGNRRAGLLLTAGRHAAEAGATHWARRLLDDALQDAADPTLSGQVQQLQGHLRMVGGSPLDAMRELLARAYDVLPDEPPTGARLLTAGSVAALIAGQLTEGLRAARLAVDAVPPATMESSLAGTVLGVLEVLTGLGAEAIGRFEEHLPVLAASPDPDAVMPRGMAFLAMMWSDDLEPARVGLRDLVGELESTNRTGMIAVPLGCLAAVEHRLGWWDAAADHAQRARRLSERFGQPYAVGTTHIVLANIAAARGEVDSCVEHVRAARTISSATGAEPLMANAAAARGLLDLGLQNPHRALVSLEEAATWGRRHGVGDAAVLASAGDLISAYIGVGRRGDAFSLLEQLDDEARRTRRLWTRAIVHRGRALLRTDDAPYDHLDASSELFSMIGLPFELSRNHLFAATQHLEDGHLPEAERTIDTARSWLEPLGARAWLARCDALAERLGSERGRTSPLRELTDQEQRVARLAATGASNRSIATTMVLTQKTIEYHLHNIYRRLQLTSRRELIELMRQMPGGGTPPSV
jgi:DNA-binding CsgD family transcriptional regulator